MNRRAIMRVIKGYEFLESVGQGGFGTVFRAFQPVIGREVAIKAISPEHTQNADFVRRFETEARLIARLEHPHIVPLYDYWYDADGAYLVMRWLPRSLRNVLADGPLPVEGVSRMLDQLAGALNVAHRQSIVHRDIKPENILLDDDNNAYLADFGIAKDLNQARTTGDNRVVGTLAYMTPEQISSEPVTQRTDLYSLGLVLYETLTGEKAFSDSTPTALLNSHLNALLPSLRERLPDLPPALDAVLQKATAKRASERYPDAPRLADAFRAAIVEPGPKMYQPIPEPLTGRELEILRLMADECSNSEIAEALYIAPGTVKWYVKQIYSKLDVHSREEAIARAADLHLIAAKSMPQTKVLPLSTESQQRTASPPTVSIQQTPYSLPVQTTAFVGREPELAALDSLLRTPSVRLVTILAPGGMGKTRLSIEAAERQKGNFAEGTCFVPLAALESAEQIVTAIAQAAHFTFYAGPDPMQQLLDYFRPRQTLLVLDNFEHLLDGAALVNDLLTAAPNVKILVTSRERLNLSTETAFSLSGLDVPESALTPNATTFSAVRFFIDCASRVRHGFQLGEGDLARVVRICHLVEGMPLGMLLSAMWVELLSLDEIADELTRNLDFLETDWRDVPERQHSLRAVFTSTWERLTASEREVFMKLSVFRGGFTSRAAQTVTGAALRGLAVLVNKALLTRDDEGRCSIHELLRQYAAEQLDRSGQADAVRDAHSTYYLNALRQRKNDLEGHNQIVTLKDIDLDLENVQAAWVWATEKQQYHSLLDATYPLWLFYYMRGRYLEGERFFAAAAERLRQHPASETRNTTLGAILAHQAQLAMQTFQGEKRDRLLAESRALTDLSAAPAELAFRLLSVNWTLAWEFRDSPTSAEPDLEQALAIYRKLGLQWETAYTLWQIANVNWSFVDKPNPKRGMEYLKLARTMYSEMGDLFGLAYVLNAFGVVTGIFFQKYEESIQYLRESLNLRRRLGTRAGIAHSLGNLGLQLAASGKLAEAEQCIVECLDIKRELANPHDAIGFDDLGEILMRQGRFEEAWRIFEEGLSRVEGTEQQAWIDGFRLWFIRLDWLQGRHEKAAAHIAEWLSNKPPVQWYDRLLVPLLGGYIALSRGDADEASIYWEQAQSAAKSQNDPWGYAHCNLLRGQIAFFEGDAIEGKRVLEGVLHFFREEAIPDMSLGWEVVFPTSRALVTLARIEGSGETARKYVRDLLVLSQQYNITCFALSGLAALAEILIAEGMVDDGVQLAAVVVTHPHTYAMDRDAAERLLKSVNADPATLERGKTAALSEVVKAVLAVHG